MNPTRQQLIAACVGKNEHAAQFLTAFVAHCHWMDDVVDMDQFDKVTAEMVTLSQNPFFIEHKDRLLPLILVAFNAWVDSDAMPPCVERDVLKGYYHEVCAVVALLTGGWDRMRAVTKEYRHYDIEPESRLTPLRPEGGTP
jgi:hypothetical protein